MPWQFLEKVYLELAEKAAVKGVIGKMTEYHAAALEQLIGPDTHIEVAGRLFLGVTYFPLQYEVTSSWATREELLNTMHASMHIPFYCQHIEAVNGRMACDGGLASPYHLIDEPSDTSAGTLIIDPFAVKCLSLVTLEPAFPLVGERYNQVRTRPEGRTMPTPAAHGTRARPCCLIGVLVIAHGRHVAGASGRSEEHSGARAA